MAPIPQQSLHGCSSYAAGNRSQVHNEDEGDSMRSPHTALAGLVGLVMLATACSGASPTPPSGSAITATLKEYSIELSASTAAPGAVTFTVTNSGSMIHEFVVLKTDIQAADLPLTNDAVTESDYTSMGEVADLQAGASGTLNATLAAGQYVMICNLPGHVREGMAVDFTVK
jgi:copper(I)-binding protein